MSIHITSFPLGGVLFQSGYGFPDHISTKGSIYVDLLTAKEYINNDGLVDWVQIMTANDISQLLREEFTWSGGLQQFTLADNIGQVYSVEVQGQGALSLSQYQINFPNVVEILDPLTSGDYIVIIYSTAILGLSDYYSQGQVDALLLNKEDKVNKKTTILGNESSNIFYPTIKSIVDWLIPSKIIELLGFTPENVANKQNNLNYDGLAVKYPTVDAVNNWTRNMAKVATKTGLLSKLDTFNLVALDNFTARIEPVESCIFWNELFVPATSPSESIKSFPQKDYPLTQLITATSGNTNVNPLTTDGIYVRYLGYDKNGNVYSATNNFITNNDIFNMGFVTVLKSGSTVSFLGGPTPGARNIFPQPNLASNTEFDKVVTTTTDVTIAANSGASFNTNSGTLVGISINWKSLQNPSNGNPIDVYNYTGTTSPEFASIDPNFLNQITPITGHTLWTESELGIQINQSFFNTTTGLRDTMNNNTASIKRIMIGVRGGIFVQEGEHTSSSCYADLDTAKNNIFNQTFNDAIIPAGVVIEIARIAYIKGASTFTNDAQVYIINTFGGGSSGTAGGGGGSDATTVTKGIIKLAGDFDATSTADVPIIVSASETLAGKVEFATSGETISGVSTTLAVHPQGLKAILDLRQITITTSVSITTATLGDSGDNQYGRHVLIKNGVNNINITIDGVDTRPTTYQKEGTGTITFIQGSGRTLRQVDGTAVLNGAVGSTASLASDGTTDSLRISNA